MKKYLSFVLVLMITLIFVGCDEDNPQITDNNPNEDLLYENNNELIEIEANICPRSVMYNEIIYSFYEVINEINLKDLEFIGEIVSVVDITNMPKENFSGNFVSLGTELYYNEEHSIIAYDKEKNIIYLGYDEKMIDTIYTN